MNRSLTRLASMGVAASVLWSTGAMAQLSPGTQAGPYESRVVDAKVVDVEQRPSMVTMLKLDNGVALVLPDSSKAVGVAPKVGDEIVAQYVDNGGEKLATSLRVLEVQAP